MARGVRFVDDYGHHPAEIAATLRVAREQAGTGRVIACLLPHQPFRVRHLKRELAEAIMKSDLACVLDVWVARGLPEDGIDGKLVVDEVCRFVPAYPVAWTPSFDDAAPGSSVAPVRAISSSGWGAALCTRSDGG